MSQENAWERLRRAVTQVVEALRAFWRRVVEVVGLVASAIRSHYRTVALEVAYANRRQRSGRPQTYRMTRRGRVPVPSPQLRAYAKLLRRRSGRR